MALDFTPLVNREIRPLEFVQNENITIDMLREETNRSVDYLLDLIKDMDDADVTFEPRDETADDPYAVAGEEHIGWSIAHLIAHVTASSEEGAAFSSLLARGVPASERPRYEVPWKEITSKAQCVHRLEESRRIRLAYLDTWPDTPYLDVYRAGLSDSFVERIGQLNAPAAFIFGLVHEIGHYGQFQDVASQVVAARQARA